MSVLTSYASQSARDSAAPAVSNTGLCIFRTDSQAIEVSDGTNYLTYLNDGVLGTGTFTSNSYSALFDGTNDYIDTGNKFDFIQQTCNFSISCWVKFTNHASTAANQFILGNTNTGGEIGMMLWYDNRSSSGSNKTLRAVVSPSGGGSSTNDVYVNVNNAITDNNWHHIAITGTAGGSLKMYRDGSLIGSTSGLTTTTASSLHNMLLGAVGTTPAGFFGGNLDEVAIFNRELTSTEVSNIINNKAYSNFSAMYRLENNANDENGVNNGTNNGATFVTSEKPY